MGPGSRFACPGRRGLFEFQTAKKAHVRIPAARFCVRVLPECTRLENRGRRECRVFLRTRSLACENEKHASIVTTGSPKRSGIPCAMVLTVSFVLSPAIGLFCRRYRYRSASIVNRCDISVEMSGPHDFAVRIRRIRPRRRLRPSHPAPNVRDDRETSLLVGAGFACSIAVSTKTHSEIFFQKELDMIREAHQSGKIS